MTLKKLLVISSLLFTFITSSCFGEDLVSVYRDALKNDPVYQSAREQYLAATEAYPQARAALLPSIQLTGSSIHNKVDVQGLEVGTVQLAAKSKFTQNQYALNFTQPIINFANFARIGAAKAQVKQAAAAYGRAAQDLMLRVAQAYFSALLAEDNLRFTEAEKRATGRQLEQAKQRYNVGLDAVTTVYEAQASYDSIVASEIAAKNDVINARESLRQITGKYYDHIDRLKINIPLLNPNPNSIDKWVIAASGQNLDILAAEFAAQAAKDNININMAGNLPTINGVGTYSKSVSNQFAVGAPGNNETEAIGVQVSLPIYQGGLVLSQTRQAEHQYQQSTADMETAYRKVMVSTRQSFNNVMAGIAKVKADKQAILSNQSSVDSTAAALQVGTRTIVDYLLVQQKLFEAEKNSSKDQYQYLIDTLTLKQLAGNLNVADFEKINSWLTSAPQPAYPEDKFSDSQSSPAASAGTDKHSHLPPSTSERSSQAAASQIEHTNFVALEKHTGSDISAHKSPSLAQADKNSLCPNHEKTCDVNTSESNGASASLKQSTHISTNINQLDPISSVKELISTLQAHAKDFAGNKNGDFA